MHDGGHLGGDHFDSGPAHTSHPTHTPHQDHTPHPVHTPLQDQHHADQPDNQAYTEPDQYGRGRRKARGRLGTLLVVVAFLVVVVLAIWFIAGDVH
jgi:hypothetical protein